MSSPSLTKICTDVGPSCPVEGSFYGYSPSLEWNVFGCIVFGVCTLAQLVMGIHRRSWSYLISVFGGCLLELTGSVGLIGLHDNAYSDSSFRLEIVCLTIAPAFLAAGIYLNLKHLVIAFGSEYSILKPHLYTWIFIFCDIISIVCQAIGSGMAAKQDPDTLKKAVNIILGGMAFQVATLIIFGLLSLVYFSRAFKHRHQLNPATQGLRNSIFFRLFLGAILLAFLCILIRCSYRLAEMDEGWRESIMQNETYFIAFDSIMCMIAVIAQTAFHPGYCFHLKEVRQISGGGGSTSVELAPTAQGNPTTQKDH